MLYNFYKRTFDLVLATILGIIFLPVCLITALAIKLESPGPALYFQKRVGRKGKIFTIYKFRSMVSDADQILASKPELLEKFKKQDWKLEMDEDPRITKIGRLVRKLTIDEMPQFLNVLKGEMSIIGPRPYRKEELEEQQERYPETVQYIKDILTVKPGITGPWQVAGRNDVSFIERTKKDAEYAQRKNILDDIMIIIKTPFAMLSKW